MAAYCLMTVQDTMSITVPHDLPAGVPFHEIISVDNTTGLRVQDAKFRILRTTMFDQADATAAPDVFVLHHMSGNVYLHISSSGILQKFVGFTFSVEIQGNVVVDPVTQNLTVVVNVADWSQNLCTLRKELCFSTSELIYKIPESLHVGTMVGSLKPPTVQHFCPDIQHIYSLPPANPLGLDDRSGTVYINQELDFEEIRRYDMNVSCQLIASGNVSETAIFNTDITLLVKDVDDNAPYLQTSTSSLLEIDSSFISAGKLLPQYFNVLDKDSSEVNNISVVLNDTLNLFSVKEVITFPNAIKNEMLISAAVAAAEQFAFPDETYNFSVIFTDEGLVTNEENKVSFHVFITNKTHSTNVHYEPPRDIQFSVNISRNAGIYARVVQPLEASVKDGYQFSLRSKRWRKIFAVTPKTGIIYLRNNTLLRELSLNTVDLNFAWRHIRGSGENYCIVKVGILDSEERMDKCIEMSGCATRINDTTCEGSCGTGSPDGLCKWREDPGPEKLTQKYATCSPDFNTCPDGICDELEDTIISLCPQDCTDDVIGEGFPSSSGRGISLAASACSCNEIGSCICGRDYSPGNKTWLETRSHVREMDHNVRNKTAKTNKKKSGRVPPQNVNGGTDDMSNCGPRCLITVGLISISTVILAISLIAFRCMRNSQNRHKYVGNRVPLTAVTSDYVDHTVTTFGHDSQPDSTDYGSMSDSKWEFPRDRLVCKETLGEGEFGKVIKAQAWEIGGRPGYTTVAVKMIKESGTDSEVHDLISEFNLLKEVSHPNIIQLLGACTTKGGPLYVIVEYAERGSLRNYLRKLRSTRETSRGRIFFNPSYFEEDRQEMGDTSLRRELFSYAWQISKGMAYLADMKVVHRDLAARNILLMENKIIKISDFGLSRDVYEGDTYLKTTKSRVPVKWMAIESLADRIYTTKSDVWSFGIVLWELITLGASPYPGIMSENLYHLLKEGYRMPQPENCPKEFYHITFACWRAIPRERPSFKELVQKLERLLQDTVDYLPLSLEEASMNKLDGTADEISTSSSSTALSSTNEALRNDGFLLSGSGSFKKNKISKSCLRLPKIPDTNYESRRLLQTPSEESTSA